MSRRCLRMICCVGIIAANGSVCSAALAQAPHKKVRLGIAATSVGFLPIYAAHQKGFYRDEGIDLEIILMSLAAANNAFFKNEIDYSAGLTGLALAAARNYPAKILIFTVIKPLQSFVSRKEIKEPRDLKGKKVAGSSPGGSATILAYQGLKHFGLEPGKDVQVLPMGGSGAGRLAVLEQGVVDAALLSVPENILALNKGYNELIFLGDVVNFPQNGFGASVARIQQQPDEVYRMVRATLRGLQFVSDDAHREQARDIMMKQWRVSDAKLAADMIAYLKRGLAKDAVIPPEAVQYFVDLTRESSNVTQPIAGAQVVDFSFLEKVRKDFKLTR
ncbi:MAG TPA: ABC transporter substrate-binding protein [Candidatus Limnocylindrales bacterium]|nr:ABC transporter substrate-binding protein [Candidatus Limnocylindrales bacterium]